MNILENWSTRVNFPPGKAIRIPKFGKFFIMESGILGLGIKDSALGIRNSSSTNKESKIQKLTAAIRRSFFPFRFSPFPVRRHYPRKKNTWSQVLESGIHRVNLKTIASNPESKTVKDYIARGRHFIENNYFLKITYFLFSLPWVPKVFFPCFGVGRRPTQSGLFPGDFSSSDGTEQIQDDHTPQKKHLTHIYLGLIY